MKIAYLMHGIGWGGAAGSLLLLLRGIQDYNATKYFYTTVDRNNEARKLFKKYTDHYTEVDLPHLRNDQAGGRTEEEAFRKIVNTNYVDIVRELEKKEVDILHINSTVLCYLLKPVKENTSIKTITHVRELMPGYGDGTVRKYMIEQIKNYSDKIICISDNEARQFDNQDNVKIMPNPFDFSKIKDSYESFVTTKYDIPDKSILIGMSGQFTPAKGHIDFLKAAEYFLKKYKKKLNKDTVFVVAGVRFNPWWKRIIKRILGKKDYGQDYLDFLKSSNVSRKVITLPYLYTDNFYKVLNEIDIYVRASKSGDPWGRDIIEAMAFGVPVVATGSSEFFVKNGESGYLVDVEAPEEIARAIYELVKDEEKRKSFGKTSRSIIREKCNLEKYSKSMAKVYEEIQFQGHYGEGKSG